jgi:preprotein translocase subunit Sec61beta
MDEQELKPPTRPAWVIWLAIVVAVLVITGIALTVLLPGQHGPGRHL